MIALLIKSSVVVAIVLAFYKIVLEKESFFSKNRLYLLGSLVLMFVLPFITLPQLVPDQGIVSTIIEKNNPEEPIDTKGAVLITEDIFEQSEPAEIYKPVEEVEEIEATASSKTKAPVDVAPVTAAPSTATEMSWTQWILLIYFFGVVVFAMHLLSQIVSLVLQIMKSTDRIEDTNSTIVNLPEIKEPCSFFNYIFINPETYDYETYEQILAHERIHVKQRHTFDLLLSEIAAIILWFNPLVWIFRKEVEKNIEYQTDDLLLREKAAEKEVYQMNLVRIATYNRPLTVTTNYNQSLIKQRLLKMNSQKSNPHSYWKYAFIAPMIFGILLILNKPNAVFAASDLVSDERIERSNESANYEGFVTEKPDSKPNKTKPISRTSVQATTTEPAAATSVLETICEKLESAVKSSNLEEVRRILSTVEPSCFPGITTADYEVFDELKIVLDDNADVFINPKTGSIIIDYLMTQIYDSNQNHKQRKDFDGGFGIKCDEILKAEKERDFDTLKKLYLAAGSECLKEPTKENLEHLEYMKFLIREGANMSILPMTIKINTTELMNPSDKKKTFNTSISSNGEASYYGSYVEMKKMGAYDDKTITISGEVKRHSTDWTDDEILENLEHNAKFKNLELHEKAAIVNIIKTDSGAFGLLEDYQELIDDNQENGRAAQKIGEAVDRIIEVAIDGKTDGEWNEVEKRSQKNRNETSWMPALDSNNFLSSSKRTKCKRLVTAIALEDIAEIERILEKVDVNCKCDNSEIFYETSKGNFEESRSALVVAARTGNAEIGQLLLKHGASIDLRVKGDGTPLIAASKCGSLDFVKLLVKNGANVNKEIKGDGTALLEAARRGHLPVVKYLISKSADVNAIVQGDGTPLINAVRNNHYEVAKYLLEKGAKPTLAVPGDENPVFHAWAKNNRRMINLLQEYDR